jgi:signal transduction histidine kinase
MGVLAISLAGIVVALIMLWWQSMKSHQKVIGSAFKRIVELENEKNSLKVALSEYSNHQWEAITAIDQFVELEQNRIAHDLHDDTVQRLVVLRLRLEQLQLYGLKSKATSEVESIRQEIDEIIRDIRFLIKGIPISQYETKTLVVLISELHDKLKSILVHKIECKVNYPEREFVLETEVKQDLLRIVQESVQNALKYSIGSKIIIEVSWENNLIINIWDDGIGSWTSNPGTGTSSMQLRALRIGAKLKIINSSRGMHIAVTLTNPKSLILN